MEVNRIVQPLRQFLPYQLTDQATLDRIHTVSLDILSDVGMAFYDTESLEILQAHGVRVDGDIAYFPPDVVTEYVAKAPSEFTQLARNSWNKLVIGGDYMTFAPVYGPPFVYDSEFGRREARMQDFLNFVKLTYMSQYLHHSGGTVVEPTDLPDHTRHLDMLYAHIRYSDKAFMGAVMTGENAQDSVEMAQMVFGSDAIKENPALLSLINISSPRRLDDRMLEALKVYVRARQAVIIAPFVLSGAMAPVTVLGTVAQINAEVLAGIAFAQMLNPGSPVVYGCFHTTVDLQNGSPVFGAPESQIALFLSAQMAQYYNLPFRTGGMFASSKISDAQAAYESVMAMLPAVLSKVNFVLHAAGWLEGGLAAGYEKFVLDHEVLGMYHKLLLGLDRSDQALALDSIREVPPGGHHLGTPHTMAHFRTAFHRTKLFDYNSAEQWQAEGERDATRRAHAEYKRLLKAYEPPPIDPALDAALVEFVEKRKQEIKPSL